MHAYYKPYTVRVGALSDCTTDVLGHIEDAHAPVEVKRGGTELCTAGTQIRRPFAVVSGWLLRTRLLLDGRRQVLGFYLPGDTVHLDLHEDPVAPCTVECLTDVTLADIEPLRRHIMNARFSDPVSAAVRSTLAMDEVIALANISRLARQSAYERVALLLLELHHRLSTVRLSSADGFHLPVTQQVLSDALGLSVVHVNRTLMQLKRDGLVDRQQRNLTLPDLEALAALVDFTRPSIGNGAARKASGDVSRRTARVSCGV